MADVKHFDVDASLDAIVALFWRKGLAATGIQDVVDATGLSRSSLYATFGNKHRMYLTALRCYIDTWATPVFDHLRDSGRGVPAIIDFFDGLVALRCSGAFARWGCMVTNAHAGVESDDVEVCLILNEHHAQLRDAFGGALGAARRERQLPYDAEIDAGADLLTSLAYTINLRSRAGAEARTLRRTVSEALQSIGYVEQRRRGGVR